MVVYSTSSKVWVWYCMRVHDLSYRGRLQGPRSPSPMVEDVGEPKKPRISRCGGLNKQNTFVPKKKIFFFRQLSSTSVNKSPGEVGCQILAQIHNNHRPTIARILQSPSPRFK